MTTRRTKAEIERDRALNMLIHTKGSAGILETMDEAKALLRHLTDEELRGLWRAIWGAERAVVEEMDRRDPERQEEEIAA